MAHSQIVNDFLRLRNKTRNNLMKGKRVRLVRCNDKFTRLQPGQLGTVFMVDDVGTLHVNWDDGGCLGLVWDDGDRWEVL